MRAISALNFMAYSRSTQSGQPSFVARTSSIEKASEILTSRSYGNVDKTLRKLPTELEEKCALRERLNWQFCPKKLILDKRVFLFVMMVA